MWPRAENLREFAISACERVYKICTCILKQMQLRDNATTKVAHGRGKDKRGCLSVQTFHLDKGDALLTDI
jgi:hypothetical protein